MAVDTLTLTYWQRRHLERQLRSARDARVYRRTLAVLEVADGEPVASVAGRLRVTLRAVYHWVATYGRDHAPAALADRDRTGRPRLLPRGAGESLRNLRGRSPRGMAYSAAQGPVPLLRDPLTRRTGRPFSDDTLRRELQRLRYSWK